jgi:hypothetical protein
MPSHTSQSGDPSRGELGDTQHLIPEPQFSGLFQSTAVEGERRLFIAVLEDAIHSFQRYAMASDIQGQARFREAEEWLMEPDTGALISFEYICEMYGFETESIRSHLRRWRDARTAEVYRENGVTVLDKRGGASGEDDQPRLQQASGE